MSPPYSQIITVGVDLAPDTSACEREINERVSGLYGLTPDQIKIVEDSTQR